MYEMTENLENYYQIQQGKHNIVDIKIKSDETLKGTEQSQIKDLTDDAIKINLSRNSLNQQTISNSHWSSTALSGWLAGMMGGYVANSAFYYTINRKRNMTDPVIYMSQFGAKTSIQFGMFNLVNERASQQSEPLNWVAGFASGALGALVTTVYENVRIVKSHQKSGYVPAFRKLCAQGKLAPWRGFLPLMIYEAIFGGLAVYGGERFAKWNNHYLTQHYGIPDQMLPFIGGAIFAQPFDFLSTLMQFRSRQNEKTNYKELVIKQIKENGIKAIFKNGTYGSMMFVMSLMCISAVQPPLEKYLNKYRNVGFFGSRQNIQNHDDEKLSVTNERSFVNNKI